MIMRAVSMNMNASDDEDGLSARVAVSDASGKV